jgi:hypothetical protein
MYKYMRVHTNVGGCTNAAVTPHKSLNIHVTIATGHPEHAPIGIARGLKPPPRPCSDNAWDWSIVSLFELELRTSGESPMSDLRRRYDLRRRVGNGRSSLPKHLLSDGEVLLTLIGGEPVLIIFANRSLVPRENVWYTYHVCGTRTTKSGHLWSLQAGR